MRRSTLSTSVQRHLSLPQQPSARSAGTPTMSEQLGSRILGTRLVARSLFAATAAVAGCSWSLVDEEDVGTILTVVAGRVEDARGVAVSGADVRVQPHSPCGQVGRYTWIPIGPSDSLGVFSFLLDLPFFEDDRLCLTARATPPASVPLTPSEVRIDDVPFSRLGIPTDTLHFLIALPDTTR